MWSTLPRLENADLMTPLATSDGSLTTPMIETTARRMVDQFDVNRVAPLDTMDGSRLGSGVGITHLRFCRSKRRGALRSYGANVKREADHRDRESDVYGYRLDHSNFRQSKIRPTITIASHTENNAH
jgi:hypothetical protein